MKRREFLAVSGAGAIGSFLSGAEPSPAQMISADTSTAVAKVFNLNEPYDLETLRYTYLGEKATPKPGQTLPPHVLLFYDKDAKQPTFVNPTDVKPVLDAGKYEFNMRLNAFNIAQANYSTFQNLKQDLQLGLNLSTPSSGGQDRLTWLFMNAVDVFFQKAKDVPVQLSKFKNYSPTDTLTPSSKVTISEGVIDLQVTAFGQRKEGSWKKLFDFAAKIVDSPLFAAFTIPSLVKQSVDFVDKTLDVFAAQDKLVPVWQTHPITFGIDKSIQNQIFFLRSGYWVTVDSEFAKQHDFLEKGFSLDFKGQSFQILAGSGSAASPIDANYLVTSIDIKKSQS